jgi:uncharacterized damage-inducible protein DinB
MNAFIEHFQLMARYNRLANERLYDSCASVSDDERKRPRKAFFTSIHGTLNHIVTGDRIWMTRFEGGEAPSTGLDAILYDDFAELWAARAIEDQRIDRFVKGLDAAFLEGSIVYINNQGKLYADPVRVLLPHFFNHQTHHRGQVHDMLSQAGVRPPVLDLHRVIVP